MALPDVHIVGILVIALTAFWLFVRETFRVEIVSLALIVAMAIFLYFFPLQGERVSSGFEIAFGGFGHEALISICCLMILGRAMVATGALEPAARLLAKLWRFSRTLGLLLTLVSAGLMSMLVNDTPVLVLLLPLLLNLSAQAGASASKTLMPVNCAILLGGMSTTIGTSTNLLVVSIAEDMGLPRFGVFGFSDIALMAVLVALPYLWLIMPRLLPNRGADLQADSRRFQASMYVTKAAHAAVSSTLKSYEKLLDQHGVRLLKVTNPAGSVTAGEHAIHPGDVLRVEGELGGLRAASDDLKMPLANPSVLDHLRAFVWNEKEDRIVAELVVGAASILVNQSIRGAQIADRYGVVVIGFHSGGHDSARDSDLLQDRRLQVGDILLVQGSREALRKLQIEEGAMVLEGTAEMPRTARAPVAILIFAAVVAAAATHILPTAIAALLGAIAVFATGCVRFDRLGRALSGEVIVLVAASIALGRALFETGAAQWLGTLLAFPMQVLPPAGVLATMMAFMALLTNFSSNTAAAAVGTPIAVSLAKQLNVPAEPLVLAVLFGCNLCFATPIAYQTNILIMSAGGYQFRDYVRAGLPLVFLMIVTLSVLLVRKYGL